MASQVPTMIQNENLHIHRGKDATGGKGETVDVGKKKGIKDGRKALADLSKAPLKPQKGPINPKDKSALRGASKPPKTNILTDEEINKCKEWAKEGIEHAHFTSSDIRKLEREIRDERVKKEVDMVMASVRSWSQIAFDSFFQTEGAIEDPEDFFMLELEPEVDLPIRRSLFLSGHEDDGPLIPDELLPVRNYVPIELELKESFDKMS